MTTAVLQFSGMQPLRGEILTISVIEGANTSRQDVTSHVGTGSNRQEALEDSQKILQIPLWSKRRKSRLLNLKLVKIFLCDFNFFWKKVLNSFASLVGSSCSGRDVSSGSLDKELTTQNSLRESPAH